MIPQEVPITPNMIARDNEGLLCQVEDMRRSTQGYEKSLKLGGWTVNYVQLEHGSFPPGTKWSKPEDEFRQFFTVDATDTVPLAVEESEPQSPQFYPFSLVLGPNFRPSPATGLLEAGDREVRGKIARFTGPSSPQALGRLMNILADGVVVKRDVSEIKPILGKGVTFNNPDRLYRRWRDRGYVGPVLSRLMRNLIKNAADPNFGK